MCPKLIVSTGSTAGHTHQYVRIHLKQTRARMKGVDPNQDMVAASKLWVALLRMGNQNGRSRLSAIGSLNRSLRSSSAFYRCMRCLSALLFLPFVIAERAAHQQSHDEQKRISPRSCSSRHQNEATRFHLA